MRSAVTVSLVEEAPGGPFVYWEGLADAFSSARTLGFDAVEIFAPGPDAVDLEELKRLMDETGLLVAAVGTGAGMVKHGLSLVDPDSAKRESAKDFIRQMIDFGGKFEAPAIIGSMQGRWGGAVSRDQALEWLGEALDQLGEHAQEHSVPLIYEPLNRYETNLLKTVAEGVSYLEQLTTKNVKLLADLFHMNIEESNLADALLAGGNHIGHIHFVDSNRQAAGRGHMDYAPIAAAIKQMNYTGYLSAEAFPIPDSQTAAQATIEAFQQYFR